MYYKILLDADDLDRIENALHARRAQMIADRQPMSAARVAETLRRLKEQGDEQRAPK